jgi:hypothetical protein
MVSLTQGPTFSRLEARREINTMKMIFCRAGDHGMGIGWMVNSTGGFDRPTGGKPIPGEVRL